ncbi:hypothetical protein FNF27_01658 [Cafeteria roenbergensis]|uniref:Acyl-CoA oxidase/dehydrogenase middle domain-containing protein n=1 Tax=Cafeteria roenbergensis TaxID=33653 RepID=A0A5A8EG48_CAFRO|nr:hypothetical protein FNF29_03936 [Cafeteria roenbergensis]KAA0176836.1 hypothetical protein FNF27_01658 [Cafeteria roenbergensis]|eukprot:KAA0152370.1 hypothetical protein FNF29_03936 [Cafeteria roenbergensis]
MRERLWAFVHEECIPAEESVEAFLSAAGHPGEATRFAVVPPVIEALKERARDLGLWNVWADEHMCHLAAGRATDDAGPCGVSLRRDIEAQLPAEPLTVSEYALLAEIMGRSELAALACNCSAPDTGNMELLSRFATPGQARRWLLPLLQGRMRSAFLMTEPDVASSDARNIACAIAVSDDGARATVSGRKWWATGACHPQCGLFLVLGVSDAGARPTRRHSIALVPASAPGVRDVTPLLVFGYDDAPAGHASVTLDALSGIKVFVPRVALAVMDRAIQVHGGAGVEGRGLLARAYAGMRCLRIADGPDDVHERTLAGLEARRVLGAAGAREAVTGRRPAKL